MLCVVCVVCGVAVCLRVCVVRCLYCVGVVCLCVCVVGCVCCIWVEGREGGLAEGDSKSKNFIVVWKINL